MSLTRGSVKEMKNVTDPSHADPFLVEDDQLIVQQTIRTYFAADAELIQQCLSCMQHRLRVGTLHINKIWIKHKENTLGSNQCWLLDTPLRLGISCNLSLSHYFSTVSDTKSHSKVELQYEVPLYMKEHHATLTRNPHTENYMYSQNVCALKNAK